MPYQFEAYTLNHAEFGQLIVLHDAINNVALVAGTLQDGSPKAFPPGMHPFVQKALSTDSNLQLEHASTTPSAQGIFPINFAPENRASDGSIKSVDSIETAGENTGYFQKIAEKLQHTFKTDVNIITHTDEAPTQITDLPEELLLGIFEKVPGKNDLGNMAQVNKKWRRISHDNAIWRPKLIELAKKHQIECDPSVFWNLDIKTIYQRLDYILSCKDTFEGGTERNYIYQTYLKNQLDARFIACCSAAFSRESDIITGVFNRDTPLIMLDDALLIAVAINNIGLVNYLLSLTGPDGTPLVVPSYQLFKLAINANNVVLADKLLSLSKEDGSPLLVLDDAEMTTAALAGNSKLLKYLLPIFYNGKESHNSTPQDLLSCVVKSKNIELIEYFLQRENPDGSPLVTVDDAVLASAAVTGDVKLFRYLYRLASDKIKIRLAYTPSLLGSAIQSNVTDMVDYVLGLGGKFWQSITVYMQSHIQGGFSSCNSKMVHHLLSLENRREGLLLIPTQQTLDLIFGKIEDMTIIERLFSLTKADGSPLYTPSYEMLFGAIDEGSIDSVKHLLSLTDADGNPLFTPDDLILDSAIQLEDIELIKHLLSLTDANGNPYLPPENWMLEPATEQGHIDVIKYLLSLTDTDGNPITPSDGMLYRSTAKVGTDLIGIEFWETDADGNPAITSEGEMPDITINRRKSESIKYLLSLTDADGAPLLVPDLDELYSALYFAIYVGDTALVDTLLSRTDPDGNFIQTIDERAVDCNLPHDSNMFLHLLTVTDKDGAFLLTLDAVQKINLNRCSPMQVALINGLCDGSISRETLSQCVTEYDAKAGALLNGNTAPGITPENGPSLSR